jgi:hypothetical protein
VDRKEEDMSAAVVDDMSAALVEFATEVLKPREPIVLTWSDVIVDWSARGDVAGKLAAVVEGTDPEHLAELVSALAAAMTLATGKMGSGPRPKPEAVEIKEKWITPQVAAEIAGVSLKRLYAWEKGKPWASNPTGRYLRINERRFRAWLETRRSPSPQEEGRD